MTPRAINQLEDILALDLLTLRDHRREGAPPLDPDEHRLRLAASLPRSVLVTVRRGESLAAYAYLWPEDQGKWFVGGLNIHPGQRNPAVLRQLLADLRRALVDNSVETLVSHVYCANAESVALHRRLGFAVGKSNDLGYEFIGSVAALRLPQT